MKSTAILTLSLLWSAVAIGQPLETSTSGNTPVPIEQSAGKREIPFDQAIMILGFEKPLASKKESLIVQNRTQETVTRIILRLVYKTPQDEMLDYREIVLDEEILPGMTKKFTIDSFDENRQYYYYLTPPTGKSIESSYPFKITFNLLRYDIAITNPSTANDK